MLRNATFSGNINAQAQGGALSIGSGCRLQARPYRACLISHQALVPVSIGRGALCRQWLPPEGLIQTLSPVL